MTPPSRKPRPLALTEDLVARVTRHVPDTGPPALYASMTLLTSDDRRAVARRLLDENPDGEFWVFGYGSLIWKPAFAYVEARRAVAHGWRRHYSLEVHSWRGTEAQPGLMLALEPGGSCAGVAYRMFPDDPFGQMLQFVEREAEYHEDVRTLRWVTLRDGQGTFRALASWVATRGDPNFIRLTIPEQVHRLARAVGYLGSCAEYLRNTLLRLEEMGIHDRYLWRLQHLVAEEIKSLHPRPGD